MRPVSRLVLTLLVVSALLSARWAGAEEELDRIVAVVNDDVITASELDEQIRFISEQLRQQGVQMPPADVLERQVLERMIVDRIQLQLAASNGIRVDDETLNQALTKMARQSGLTLQQFRATIEKGGFDFAEFREQIRNEITIHRLRQRVVDDRVTVSESEVNASLARQPSPSGRPAEYHLAHILIALPEAASPEQIEAARAKAEGVLARLRAGADFQQTAIAVSEGQQALQGGDLGWRKPAEIPSIFVEAVARMQSGDISDPIRSPSGFHIVKLVEARSAAAPKAQQALVRHIMVRGDEGASDADLERRVRALARRLATGEDFAKVAQESSDDANSAAQGGNLGWIKPGELPDPFPEVLGRLQTGAVSEPFKSPYGWHIVQVVERREGGDGAESAKTQTHQAVRSRKIEEETQAWLRRLRDEAYVEYRLEESL